MEIEYIDPEQITIDCGEIHLTEGVYRGKIRGHKDTLFAVVKSNSKFEGLQILFFEPMLQLSDLTTEKVRVVKVAIDKIMVQL